MQLLTLAVTADSHQTSVPSVSLR